MLGQAFFSVVGVLDAGCLQTADRVSVLAVELSDIV